MCYNKIEAKENSFLPIQTTTHNYNGAAVKARRPLDREHQIGGNEMKKFELGMKWFRDWHDFEVTKIFKNGKIQITETWISEDSGKECKSVATYNVSEDEYGQFAWQDKYKEYAFDETEEDGYHWWARTYACGAEWSPSMEPQEPEITDEDVWAELEWKDAMAREAEWEFYHNSLLRY